VANSCQLEAEGLWRHWCTALRIAQKSGAEDIPVESDIIIVIRTEISQEKARS
jgi:hypothetical protein